MKLSIIIFISLLLFYTNTQNKESILALTWFSGFCEENECSQNAINAWDHQSFTIHGFWPQQQANYSYGAYNRSLISGTLQDNMLNYWPAQSRSRGQSDFLWFHQFSSHGADFCEIYYDDHLSQFTGLSARQRNDKLQKIYFNYTINLYTNLKVRKIPQSSYKKSDFAKLLGIKQNQFSIICTNNGNLAEIRICYNIKATGAIVSTCQTGVTNRKCKLNSFTLGEWRQNAAPSGRVTAI